VSLHPVEIADVPPPGMFPAVCLESVDAHIFNEVATLLSPPRCCSTIPEVGHESQREPPAAVAVWAKGAIRSLFLNQVALANGGIGVSLHLPNWMRPHLDQRDLPEVYLD